MPFVEEFVFKMSRSLVLTADGGFFNTSLSAAQDHRPLRINDAIALGAMDAAGTWVKDAQRIFGCRFAIRPKGAIGVRS